jgi:outer membrane immunogenic protein
MKKIIAIAVAVLGSGSIASAADLAVKAPPMTAPVPVFSWTGFYIGANVGGAWGTKEWTGTSEQLDAAAPVLLNNDVVGTHTVNGFLGGGQIGYNYQAGWTVFGLEAQGDWSNLTGKGPCFTEVAPGATFDVSNRCSANVRGLATFAARFGVTWDHTMVFVKGGGAWANDRFSLHSSSNSNFPPSTVWNYGDITDNRWGGMVGLGIEQAFGPNWSAKVEYDFMDFGTKNYTFIGSQVTPLGVSTPVRFSSDISQTIHLVKVGLNYRFNWGGPLVAHY